MITPQLTEQYGQVLRVSVVRAIFNPCVWAYTGARLKPNAESPAPPTTVVLRNVLLETCITLPPIIGPNMKTGCGTQEKRWSNLRRSSCARIAFATCQMELRIDVCER